ncbi:hypothetical protein BDC45DRAFT_540857 [Circinella umbellata]|nr:hypothetical protein BDC45DRAFT_540857 [Circinella umbellata]
MSVCFFPRNDVLVKKENRTIFMSRYQQFYWLCSHKKYSRTPSLLFQLFLKSRSIPYALLPINIKKRKTLVYLLKEENISIMTTNKPQYFDAFWQGLLANEKHQLSSVMV